ncbi:MAG: tRNA pseudouridine(38-40) synthase TruA [Bacteroidetes bacterium]|nr:tRNA pseudouridine(38-40) synthase TruA [Bacteroidota bacterium]
MQRYFIEVQYKGTSFSGFQTQPNALTIQGEIDKALRIFLREEIQTTTSSRTDAGVHAHQNFLHFDTSVKIHQNHIYHINSILPSDIVVKNIYLMDAKDHARFDALSRVYTYHLLRRKNPFKREYTWFYPHEIQLEKLQEAAIQIVNRTDFTSFSKKNTDVLTFQCKIISASWVQTEDEIIFTVEANRYLRGMVRGLVATQLLVGRNKISIEEFNAIANSGDCEQADFSAPASGLFLERVNYPNSLLQNPV